MNPDVKMTVNVSDLETIICGISNMASALGNSVFDWRESAYHDGQKDINSWFYQNYSILAGINEIICGASSIILTALCNGEIEIKAKGVST